MDKLLNFLQKHYTSIGKNIILTGMLIIFFYCTFIINFYPNELTIADTLVFIFMALGFGTLYSLWIGIGYLCIYMISYPYFHWNDDTSTWLDKTIITSIGCILLLIYGFFLYNTLEKDAIGAILVPLISGITLVISINAWAPNKDNTDNINAKHRKNMILLSLLGIPLMSFLSIGALLNISLNNMGIRKENILLELDENNYNAIKNIAEDYELPIFNCSLDDSRKTIYNTDLLWHGIGSISLAKVDKKFTIELNSKGVKAIKIIDENIVSCLKFQETIYYDSYAIEANLMGKARIKKMINKINHFLDDKNLTIHSGKIIGYADNMIPIDKNVSNYILSKRRAENIKDILKQNNIFTDDTLIETFGISSFGNNKKCVKKLSIIKSKECKSEDRKVKVILQFSKKKVNKAS